MFLFLVFGLLNLIGLQGNKFKDLSNNNCIRLTPQLGCRGKILDRNGEVIVDSRISYDLAVMPSGSVQLENTFAAISKLINKDVKDLRKSFNYGYFSPSVPVTVARNINLSKVIAIEQIRSDYQGIVIQPTPVRNYPYSSLGSHFLGYVNEIDRWRLTKLKDYGYKTKDIVGFGGVEEKYDYYLRQEQGGLSVEVDHRGRFVRLLGFKPPRNGKDIQLTINLKIQKIAESSLGERKGCVVIINPNTGEILAMASSPDFDPSLFVNRSGSGISNLFSNSSAPLMNRAISATYPAGSIFKVVVSTAALETKKINQNTSFLCQGSAIIGRSQFKCWNTHGMQNLIGGLTHSCNVFFYKTGLLTGALNIHDYAIKLGFGHNTSFELPYEVPGFIPSPIWRKINKFQNWFDGDTANLSIGQGDVAVTPIQVVRMMSVFANKGYLVTPYIVKNIDGRDISKYQTRIEKLNLKISNIELIRQGLRRVVSEPTGTGNVLSSLPVSIAGKTGTAQAPPGQPHAWFVGFFPYEKPKFAICVLLDHGGPGYYSCLVGKQIIDQMSKEGLI